MTKDKIFGFAALILVGLGVLLIGQSMQTGKLRLIACDVGQGDALLLVTPGGSQVVIDGGPNNKVVDCLARYMPFWDRKIEVVINTHPQQDHLQGLVKVLNEFEVGLVVRTPVEHTTALYKTWQSRLQSAKIKTYNAIAGESLIVDGLEIEVLWPDREHLDLWRLRLPSDLNETSIVLRVNPSCHPSHSLSFPRKRESISGCSESADCIYLTGDINVEILEKLIDRPCDVLKVAHHGSRTGTTELLLSKVKPKIALMQLGVKNRFHHPHQEVLDMFSKFGVKILRNDLDGDLEVDWDRKEWNVRTER